MGIGVLIGRSRDRREDGVTFRCKGSNIVVGLEVIGLGLKLIS